MEKFSIPSVTAEDNDGSVGSYDFRSMFASMFGNGRLDYKELGIDAKDGFATTATVSGTTMTITVGPGAALINGMVYQSDANKTYTTSVSSMTNKPVYITLRLYNGGINMDAVTNSAYLMDVENWLVLSTINIGSVVTDFTITPTIILAGSKIKAHKDHSDRFTYVIRTQEDFNIWYSGEVGYDFSYVGVYPGEYTAVGNAKIIYDESTIIGIRNSGKNPKFINVGLYKKNKNSIVGLFIENIDFQNSNMYLRNGDCVVHGAKLVKGCNFTILNLESGTKYVNSIIDSCTNVMDCVFYCSNNIGLCAVNECTHINNCRAIARDIIAEGSDNTNHTKSYYMCEYMENCYGNYGRSIFHFCNYLTDCHFTKTKKQILGSNNLSTGFNNCKYLYGCYRSGDDIGNFSSGNGYYQCSNLTACSDSYGIPAGYSFRYCTRMVSCIGSIDMDGCAGLYRCEAPTLRRSGRSPLHDYTSTNGAFPVGTNTANIASQGFNMGICSNSSS